MLQPSAVALWLFFLAAGTVVFGSFSPPRVGKAIITVKTAFGVTDNQQDDDVLRVTTDLVVLNATVVGKDGRFVSGLKRNDFRVFEDGQEQKIANFTAEETPFAAAILLDVSGSMDTRLTLGRSAALRFLEGLRDEDVASVYSFYTKVEQWGDFSPGRDLPDKVFGLRARTLTA